MGVGVLAPAADGRTDVDALIRHYAVAGPCIERLMGPIPFVWVTLMKRGGARFYHGPLSDHTVPKAAVVDVTTASGVHRYPQLSTSRIEGLVRHGATEIHSWSPRPGDPARAAFGRLVMARGPKMERGHFLEAVAAIVGAFNDGGVRSVPLFDGGTGVTLWFPFSDGPGYEALRVWLHATCASAAAKRPELFTLEPNSHGEPLAHLHSQTNAVGRFSILPYAVRADKRYPVALPLLDAEFSDYPGDADEAIGAEAFGDWLKLHGDAFAQRVAAIGAQTFGSRGKPAAARVYSAGYGEDPMPSQKPHGPVVAAAYAVLQDGIARDASAILAVALERGLLDASTTYRYVYTALIEYIARANGNGRKPAMVQNADRTFRINEPADLWPPIDDGAVSVMPERQALADRLQATVGGSDYAAFETAVCDAFAALGFATTHVGGNKAPDGYADAPLGPLGYRVMIECKSAGEGVNDPHVVEAAKFRDAYGAQFCALVARSYAASIELGKELHEHEVSAWTVEDLQTLLLRAQTNPLEIKPLFAPGFAADALDDVLWERHHGLPKRVRLVADAIVRVGWETQAAYRGSPAEAPRLTEDAAMMLVDQDLAASGSAATCTRDEVRAAFAYLSNPLVGAVALDVASDSVVVLGPNAP